MVIETVGNAAVLAQACAAAARGGRIVTVGLPNPAEMLSILAPSLVVAGKTVAGSYMRSSIPARDIPRYVALWRAGRFPVERLLTPVSPLCHQRPDGPIGHGHGDPAGRYPLTSCGFYYLTAG